MPRRDSGAACLFREAMKRKAGQSLLETCIVMMLLCLIFFGLLQLSQLSAAKEILDYAASCGSRARTVGFNEFMCYKVVNVAAIPNAGNLLEPIVVRPPNPVPFSLTPGEAWDYALTAQPVSPQAALERERIPLYLGGETWGRLPGILDYEYWNSGDTEADYTINRPVFYEGGNGLGVHTGQRVPLWTPLHRLIYDGDDIALSGDAIIENHYPLYLGND
jgi:hypothetical protein